MKSVNENIKVNSEIYLENHQEIQDSQISQNNVEIWEDLANIKDLVIALMICIITTFGGYFLSPNESYKPMLFGLTGAVIGFIISSFLIKPKREFIQENKES